MNRRSFLWTQAGGFAGLGFLGFFSKARAGEPARKRPHRGINLAGAEFGADKLGFSNATPGELGKDFTYNSERTFAYFCAHGLRLLRLPLRWERIQPRLGQPLDEAELERLKTATGWARKHGGQVIIDIHNFARYVVERDGRRSECVIDQPDPARAPVSRNHFADLWRRLAQVFREETAVYAYGLMNEPHDLGTVDWKPISQAAVDAIRAEKDDKLILVAGDDWSNAPRFSAINGKRAWIKDRADRIAYEAHCYLDHDSSGHYELDYAAELARDSKLPERGPQRLQPFVRWCRANRVPGFLGEFGIPGGDARWQPVLARFLEALDAASMDSCYWAAGEWWGAYPLSLQPRQDFQQPAPQLRLVER
jgi:endoglucanase